MKKQDYHSSITVSAGAEEALERISQVPEWWATDFEGTAKKLNDVFIIHFDETSVTFTIPEFVAGKKIVWAVTDCNLHWLEDKKEWKGTKISFSISAKGSMTEVSVTHIGLVPGIECYNDCKKGWDFFIKESLFKLITEGKGLPQMPKVARYTALPQVPQ